MENMIVIFEGLGSGFAFGFGAGFGAGNGEGYCEGFDYCDGIINDCDVDGESGWYGDGVGHVYGEADGAYYYNDDESKKE